MKIVADIEVERIQRSESTFSFRAEEMELEVVNVMRQPADSTGRNRYYYQADVKRPARMHPDARNYGFSNGLVRVNIVRKRNPKWKPPKFPAGVNFMPAPATD